MKKFLSNKKYLTAIIFSVVSVLTVALILPQVFALNDGKGELVKPKEQENMAEDQIQEIAMPQESIVVSAAEKENVFPEENSNIEPQAKENSLTAVDNTIGEVVLQPIIENELIKITDDEITFSNEKFVYNNTEEIDGYTKSVKRYVSDDRSELLLESETNEVIKWRLKGTKIPEGIPQANGEENALKIASQFAKKLCSDFDKYNFVEKKEPATGYHIIVFRRTINNYKTAEWISVQFDENYNLVYYNRSANVFDGFDLSNIVVDGEKIKEKIIQNSKNYYGDNFAECDFKSMLLTVKDSKIVMEVSYVPLDKNGNSLTDTAILMGYFDIN